jgi:hypothetical protein
LLTESGQWWQEAPRAYRWTLGGRMIPHEATGVTISSCHLQACKTGEA